LAHKKFTNNNTSKVPKDDLIRTTFEV